LRYIFDQMDTDNDGALDEDEILEGITTLIEEAKL
jgi:hypothetical protein